MKRLLLVPFILLASSCSFDNKTGIWNDASDLPINRQTSNTISNSQAGTQYEDIFIKNQIFNEEKIPDENFQIKIDEPIKIFNWAEQYGISTNNISNFSYSDNKLLLSKSIKLSKNSSSKNNLKKKIIFYKDNLISYDHKGRIFVYSMSLNKKILFFDFYKKKLKKFNKELSFIVNKNILYISDNLGYLYALNLDNKSIVWAKNYGIPFRSNLKITDGQLFLANQDNVIYSINPATGDKIWEFATAITSLKSSFENNFALDQLNNILFFLNTSGELYSINFKSQKVNWVLNFKNFSLNKDTQVFLSQPIVVKNNNFIITTEKNILSYDKLTALRNWSFPAESTLKPIVTSNYTFVVLKNNLLVCLDNSSGNVVWSKNIFSNALENKIVNKFATVVDFKLVNNEINIYSTNGYLLSFKATNGNLNYSGRLNKKGILSEIFFLNDYMLFVDNRNRLLKFN